MKGQYSVEFLILFITLTFLATVILYINFIRGIQFGELKKNFDAQRLSNAVENEISIAIEQGDGYQRIFLLPTTTSADYDTTIYEDGSVGISWKTGNYIRKLPTKNITNGDSNNFQISTGLNKISNKNGIIFITEV